MADLIFRQVLGVPHRLETGGVQVKKIGLSRTLQREFARQVDCLTGHSYIAVDARSAVILGSDGIISRDLSSEVLYRIEREELVAGGDAVRAAI